MTLPCRFVLRSKCEKVYEEPSDVPGTLEMWNKCLLTILMFCFSKSIILTFLSSSDAIYLPNPSHPASLLSLVLASHRPWTMCDLLSLYLVWLHWMNEAIPVRTEAITVSYMEFFIHVISWVTFLLHLNNYVWIPSPKDTEHISRAGDSQKNGCPLGTWTQT